jgi:hypothetical protein
MLRIPGLDLGELHRTRFPPQAGEGTRAERRFNPTISLKTNRPQRWAAADFQKCLGGLG